MALFNNKQAEDDEPYMEVNETVHSSEGVKIKIADLKSFSDTERIQDLVRDGHVVFLRIRNLRQKDINELKRSVDKLKKTIHANNGDIVGVDEDFIILTPKYAKVFR
ncbi:MAG TPA: cell division protein SepF [archaeon]|nr:cell division protein SepF [archaeon]